MTPVLVRFPEEVMDALQVRTGRDGGNRHKLILDLVRLGLGVDAPPTPEDPLRQRDAAIRALLRAGVTKSEIARIVDMTRQRVQQITAEEKT